jgi:hypothetical protein
MAYRNPTYKAWNAEDIRDGFTNDERRRVCARAEGAEFGKEYEPIPGFKITLFSEAGQDHVLKVLQTAGDPKPRKTKPRKTPAKAAANCRKLPHAAFVLTHNDGVFAPVVAKREVRMEDRIAALRALVVPA